MLYLLAKYLQQFYDIPGLRLFQYITFRAGLAIVLSLIISIIFGKRIVNWLRQLQIGESVRDLGLKGQKEKEGTPTMGGVIIILAILVPTLLLCDLNNVYIVLMLFATTWMAIIGFIDDYIKVFRKKKDGLDGKFKIAGQIGLGLIVAMTMLWNNEITVRIEKEKAENSGYQIITRSVVEDHKNLGTFKDMANVKTTLTNVPFLKGNQFEYGDLLPSSLRDKWVWLLFVLVVIFIITAVSNAANLTDGLDGLATGVSAIIGATLGVLAYVSSNTIFADYLNIFYLPGTSELVIFCACFIGACIGFLWYNAYPATVFMGDTGSLTLGGIIAALAIILRKELLIPVLCGIFLVENLSVVLQVGYFKYTKRKSGEGKRIFLMAPLHHHYQKKGYHEAKIVTRFWVVAVMLAVLTIITLKIR